jgi:hypothetical protein
LEQVADVGSAGAAPCDGVDHAQAKEPDLMGTMVEPERRTSVGIAVRLATMRAEIRRLVLRHGLALLLVTVLMSLLVFCSVDWLLHVSSGMRVLFLVVLAGLTVWTIYRRLIVPLSVPISDLQLALRIERLHPELEETLSSTIALLPVEERDPRAGSPALRRALVELARERVEPIRFDDVVDSVPSRKALGWGVITTVGSLLLMALFPTSAWTAITRLANPFGPTEWPKRTQITALDYLQQMAKGDPFTVRAVVKGVIPERMTIEYRFADGQQVPASAMMPAPTASKDGEQPSSDAPAEFVATLDGTSQPFEFAVKGGDADTGWLAVVVVPAPDVTRLDVTVTPPEYSLLSPSTLPEGKGHVKGIVGSKVVLSAESNKPIRAGKLAWEKGTPTAGVVSAEKNRLTAEFVIGQSDTYQIFLEDEQGMTNEHRSPRLYRVDALADAAPEVKIDQPTEDMEVTRQARVPIKWIVRDDIGIAHLDRVYSITKPGMKPGGDETEATIPTEQTRLFEGADRPKQTTVNEEWDLAPLELPTGSVVTFKGVARDYRTPPEPNVGESRSIRLLIVSQGDFVRQIENEQKLIREEIQRLRKMEESALEQTGDLAQQAQVKETLDNAGREKLQTVEMTQRRIREKTTGEDGSIQDRIRQLNEKIAANRIDYFDTTKRLALMESELGRIQEQHLAPIENELTTARKNLSGDKPKEGAGDKKPAESLEEAREHQQQVVESLDAMLDQLDKWESVADVVNEARDLERRQAELSQKVSELAAKTLGKPDADLTGEEKGAIAQAGTNQEEIRQQLNRLERKLTKQAEKTQSDDPVAADAMKEALDKSQQENIGGKMSEAASKIRGNKLADAGLDQSQVGQSLREMVESLENRREQDLKRLIKNLKQAEEDLAGIREEQKKLRKETEEASKEPDPEKREEELRRLSQRQEELRKKSEEFARRLSQLQAKKASQSAGRAASRMNDATGQMAQGEGGNAEEQQDQAEEQLEDAANQLAEARQEAEQQLANEQLAKVADTIKLIHQRQIALKDDVARLDGIREKEGKLTRGQIQSLLGLSRAEKGLADESAALKEQLAEAKVFQLVIEEAVDQMNKGSAKLAEKETGLTVQKPLDKARQKFEQLIDSLRKDPNQRKGRKGNQQEGQGEGEGGGGSGGDGIPSIAQIKLLKSLQQEILGDTKSLVESKKSDQWSPDQEQELSELSKKQGRLADLVRDLMKPTEEGSTEEVPQ